MTETIFEYLQDYGKYTFVEKPLNEVDALILSQLSYLKFDGIVPDIRERGKSVTLSQVSEHEDFQKLFSDERFRLNNKALYKELLESRRFEKMGMNYYISITEVSWETQFSAITFFLEDGTVFVAYRGTDETIVGWKENFNMGYMAPVPSQIYSAKYLYMVADRVRIPFYVGGHSKGGNLAVYASMKVTKKIQDKILAVYNLDGPGFHPDLLKHMDYESIRNKEIKIVPHFSLVGMIFETENHYKVIQSNGVGLMQHDPFSWLVEGNHFMYVDGIYEGQKFWDDTLNEWVLSQNEDQIRCFVEALYQVISASKADNLIELTANWKDSVGGMINAIKDLDEESKKIIRQMTKALFEMLRYRVKENLPSKRRK